MAISRSWQRKAAPFAALAIAAILTGCGTPPNEPSTTGAIDTGAYPNLNIKPGVANQQFTPAERSAKIQEVAAAKTTQAGQRSAPPNDLPLLRKIGQTHAKEAIAEIEGK